MTIAPQSTSTARWLETVAHCNSKTAVPALGVGDKIGEGDTYPVENVLPPEPAEVVSTELTKEVAWNATRHVSSSLLAFLITPIARQGTQRRP